MAASGLLRHIVPELYAGVGVEQPEFHHLDVFHHCFAAFEQMANLATKAGVEGAADKAIGVQLFTNPQGLAMAAVMALFAGLLVDEVAGLLWQWSREPVTPPEDEPPALD